MGEQRSEGITESLISFGFYSGRLKTGTSKIRKEQYNWEKTSISFGDDNPTPFSYSTKTFKPPNEPCYNMHSNVITHDIIRHNLHLSPMFTGDIGGKGPRYCPSIEDKINRFTEETATAYLEPSGKTRPNIPNGFSTSLPEEAQNKR